MKGMIKSIGILDNFHPVKGDALSPIADWACRYLRCKLG